jgi:hypothetical protein
LNSEDRDGTPTSNSRKINEGKTYKVSRIKSGAKVSSWSGEYVAAIVVHARERKTRLRDVDHDESMGIARREARGAANGVRRAVRDIAIQSLDVDKDV